MKLETANICVTSPDFQKRTWYCWSLLFFSHKFTSCQLLSLVVKSHFTNHRKPVRPITKAIWAQAGHLGIRDHPDLCLLWALGTRFTGTSSTLELLWRLILRLKSMSLGYSYSLYIRTTRSCIINAFLRLQISKMLKNLSNLYFHILCLMFRLPRFRLLSAGDNGRLSGMSTLEDSEDFIF